MARSQAQYSVAFSEHSVHENLKLLKARVEGLPDALLEAAREHDPKAALPRLEPALDYIAALLASADTALVTPKMLDALDAVIQQISSALTPFEDNSDFAQVPTIQGGIDGLLDSAAQLAPAIGLWAKTDEKKAAAHLGEAAMAKTRQLQEQASDLQGQLDRLREQADQASESAKAEAEERVKELQGQLDTLKAEAEAERTRVQQTIDSLEAQFKSEQETRNAQFEESKKSLTHQTEQLIQESKEAAEDAAGKEKERAEAAVTDLRERGNELLAFLVEKKKEAIDMVDAAATSSTAGAFKKEAEEQKREADQWRIRALGFGGIAIGMALFAVILAVEEVGDTSSFIFAKIAAITLLLGIAGYAAGQSGQHRHREKRARRLYLELVAFKPFTEPLPELERHAVRKEFIERLFVGDPGAEGEDHKNDDVKLSDENLSVLLKFVDVVRSSR